MDDSAHTSSTIPTDDEAARRRIGPWEEDGVPTLDAFDPHTNFVVRAAAGSGKTTALVARMVALVRTGVPVEDLTAITFTRKAAGEMSTRFFRELQRTRRALPARSEQRARVSAALGRVQSAFIGTIHAFCSRLLRERPLAAGLPPDFTAGLEDREERRLRDRAWQQHLRWMDERAPDRLRRISEFGLDPQDLTTFFDRLCAHSELTPYVNPPDVPPPLETAVARVQEKLGEWTDRVPETLPKGKDPVMNAFDKAERMVRYQDLDRPAEQAAFLQIFADVADPERARVKVTYWEGEEGAKDWARSLRDEHLPSLIEQTVRPALRAWEAQVHEAVVRFTRPAVERYRTLRQNEGALTFHDLLAHTRDLLRDQPAVRRTVQRRYPILLVDEFQDTDPLQAEILAFLSSQSPDETDWRACRPRDGSLFIVGDDKQSIYRFRRADKEVFDDVRRRLDAEPNGEAVDLTKNFRSRAPICEWCNDAFSSIFADPELEDLQAEYVPFDPQRPAGPDGTALRRNVLEKVSRNRGREIAEQDAERIARFIEGARAGKLDADFYRDDTSVFSDGVDYSDFLILTRVKTRLGLYTDVLARYGIPYTVTGSEDLGAGDEFRAVLSLLRCALRPDDPVAAVAYLKGPLVGLSDADLYRYRRAGGRFDRMADPVPDAVRSSLSPERGDRVERAVDRLRTVRSIVRERRPGVGIKRLVDHLGLLAGAAHPAQPEEASLRAGAVLRIVSAIEHLGAQGQGWGEIVEDLDRVREGEVSLDGMTLETGGGDAVRVMNVHQAKGLEAPVVFLADPYTSGRPPSTKVHLRREEGEIVAPVVQGEDHFERVTHAPLGWHEDSDRAFKAEEERHQAAEERRLLYVAATRAERLLAVSTYPEKPDDGYWAPLYAPLRAAEVPELTVPEVDASADAEASAPDLDAGAARRRRHIDRQSEPAFRLRSVTEDGKEAAGIGPERDGYGAVFGTALHTLFELAVRHRGEAASWSDPALRRVLDEAEAEASDAAVEALRRMLATFRASGVWAEISGADRVHTEHPFARRRETGAEIEILQGTIDLLYRRGDAWTLVDYKSDRVGENASTATLEAALAADHAYRRQIRMYRAAWEELAGAPVESAGLWFADAGVFVPVKEP